MAVPDFQSLMLPVLKLLGDGEEHRLSEAAGAIGKALGLSEADQAERLPVAKQTRLYNRLAWAHNYLKQAGLLESSRRGVYRITQRGREALKPGVARIDIRYLDQFPEFVAFRTASTAKDPESSSGSGVESAQGVPASLETQSMTPEEQIAVGYGRLREAVVAQLLERTLQVSPAFFEQLVIEVLVAMGYGGTEEDAAQVVGRSGDGGIDGIIKRDRLGVEMIYVQAKRWQGTVGRPVLQQFAGALGNQKGVFITTSSYTREALEFAKQKQGQIVLINGQQLAELMLDYGVGVSEGKVLKLKKIDEDYFGEG